MSKKENNKNHICISCIHNIIMLIYSYFMLQLNCIISFFLNRGYNCSTENKNNPQKENNHTNNILNQPISPQPIK